MQADANDISETDSQEEEERKAKNLRINNIGKCQTVLRNGLKEIMTKPMDDLSIFTEDIKVTDASGNVVATGKTEYREFLEQKKFLKIMDWRLSMGSPELRIMGVNYDEKKKKILIPMFATSWIRVEGLWEYKINEQGLIYEHLINAKMPDTPRVRKDGLIR